MLVTLLLLLLFTILSGASFLYEIRGYPGTPQNAARSVEADYLYSYRGALIKVLQIQSELDAIGTEDYFNANAGMFFNRIETEYLKQQSTERLNSAINNYDHGLTSLPCFHTELEAILKQLDVLVFRLRVA